MKNKRIFIAILVLTFIIFTYIKLNAKKDSNLDLDLISFPINGNSKEIKSEFNNIKNMKKHTGVLNNRSSLMSRTNPGEYVKSDAVIKRLKKKEESEEVHKYLIEKAEKLKEGWKNDLDLIRFEAWFEDAFYPVELFKKYSWYDEDFPAINYHDAFPKTIILFTDVKKHETQKDCVDNDLINYLSTVKDLETLRLNNSPEYGRAEGRITFNGEGFGHLSHINLKSLEIEGYPINKEGLKTIIKTFPELTYLHIRGSKLENNIRISGIGGNKKIQELLTQLDK